MQYAVTCYQKEIWCIMAGYQNFKDTVQMRRSRMAGKHARSAHINLKNSLAHIKDSLVFLSGKEEEQALALIHELDEIVTKTASLFSTHISDYNRYGEDAGLQSLHLDQD